jgi:L-ribulose-5-phosphate 3-epimerase
MDLGQEVPIGKGKVDFPRIIAGLKELDYRGAVTIERETSGPQQKMCEPRKHTWRN